MTAFADKCTGELDRGRECRDVSLRQMNVTVRRLRIVVVASDVHYWTTSEKELVESPNIHAKRVLYTRNQETAMFFDSILLFACAFQRRLPPSTVTVSSVNPGFCISNFCSTSVRLHTASMPLRSGRFLLKSMCIPPPLTLRYTVA